MKIFKLGQTVELFSTVLTPANNKAGYVIIPAGTKCVVVGDGVLWITQGKYKGVHIKADGFVVRGYDIDSIASIISNEVLSYIPDDCIYSCLNINHSKVRESVACILKEFLK